MGDRRWTIWTAATLVAGCVAQTPHPAAGPAVTVTDRSALPLEAIGPAPRLPSAPTTRPLGRPPVDALVAYAAGRDALTAGNATAAVAAFRRAADLDPGRFDVQYALATALQHADAPAADSIAAIQTAVDQHPDDVDLWSDLGRQYLAARQPGPAVTALRTALLTTGYRTDPGRAGVVDLLLARALAADGYDRAALDRYGVLLRRFKEANLSVGDNPDLAQLADHPDALFEPIGRLYDRHADWSSALQAYAAAAAQAPDRFDVQAAMAMDRARLGRAGDRAAADAAVGRAADLVVRDAASPATLALLDDVCRQLGRSTVDELRRVSAAHPRDRALRFATAEALVAADQPDAADDELAIAWRTPGDLPLTRRLAALYRRQGRTTQAARLVIATSAANPEAAEGLGRTWDALLRPDQPNHLTTAAVANLAVETSAESARQFWLARTAAGAGHSDQAMAALDRAAAAARPAFPPAARSRADTLTPAAADVLAARLPPALAGEVRGRALLNAGRPADAVAAARAAGGDAPAALLLQARAAHAVTLLTSASHRDDGYEAALSALVHRDPTDEDATLTLFGYLVDPDVGKLERALAVLNTWRTADPDNVAARLLQARTDHQLNNADPADHAVDPLLSTDGDDPDVLAAAAAVFGDRRDVLLAKLEADHAAHPRSADVTAELAGVYARAGRRADAVRTLDATRSAAAGEAVPLYTLAGLYATLGQPATAEAVLGEVLRADPSHPAASNDLGFTWADAGRNLDRAEALIRTAVAAEPDNAAFLDSLGWVLYKRGRFAEAEPLLARAVGPPSSGADPSVLDHLGDDQYRLDRPADARRTWLRALSASGRSGDDPSPLRLQLQQKLRQADGRRSVDVAPVAAAAAIN